MTRNSMTFSHAKAHKFSQAKLFASVVMEAVEKNATTSARL